MADYALTGKKGTGKTKHAVQIIRDRYLARGFAVATNLDIDLKVLFGPRSRKTYIRVPDKPTSFDLMAAGHGNPDSYDENKNGALVLDEMATWLNTRTFADKDRAAVLDFIAHGRKLGWDSYFIMQDVGQVDKQLRESFLEYVVRHRRFDRVKVPFVGWILQALFGERAAYFPRFHVAVTRAGTNPTDLVTDRATFRGDDLHAAYDTRQIFRPDYPHGCFTVLSPWHVEGRFLPEPAPSWWAGFFSFLRGKPMSAVRKPSAPVSVPPAGLPRVLELARRLPSAEATRIVGRYLRQVDAANSRRPAPGAA